MLTRRLISLPSSATMSGSTESSQFVMVSSAICVRPYSSTRAIVSNPVTLTSAARTSTA